MKYYLTVKGHKLVNSDGKPFEYETYKQADHGRNICNDDNVLITYEGDINELDGTFTAFLVDYPDGTKGIKHYVRWWKEKADKFEELYDRNQPDFYTRFIEYLKHGLDKQLELKLKEQKL